MLSGTLEGLERGVVAACHTAFKILPGISSHQGGHPRKGTVDLIPIHPVTDDTPLEECGDVALNIAQVNH